MKLINVRSEEVVKAVDRAKNQPEYKGSFTRNKRKVIGNLGEEVFLHTVGADKVKPVYSYDFDFETVNGITIDIKSKTVSYPPKPQYTVDVPFKSMEKQNTDIYFFYYVHNELHTAWELGWISKKELKEHGDIRKKGEADPSDPRFIYKVGGYYIEIEKLKPLRELLDLIKP